MQLLLINQFAYLQTHSSVTALLYNDVIIIFPANVELKQHELIKLTKLKHKSSKTNILLIWKLLVMYYANAVNARLSTKHTGRCSLRTVDKALNRHYEAICSDIQFLFVDMRGLRR